MYWISEARNIQSRHRLRVFQKSTMSNTFLMIPRTNTMCGTSVRLVKAKSMKLKDTQLHLFMRKKCLFFFDVGDSFGTIQTQSKNETDTPCTDKACILNFSSYKKLEKHLNFGHNFEAEN